MKEKSLVVVGSKKRAAVRMAEDIIARYPWAVNPLLQSAAALLSPFDRCLRMGLLRWEKRVCELRVPKLRRLRDQGNQLHPGVASAFGERAAFFLLQRNYPFWQYSADLQEVQTIFSEKGSGAAVARCELETGEEVQTLNALREKGRANLRLKSELRCSGSGALIATVRTSWRLRKREWAWENWKF